MGCELQGKWFFFYCFIYCITGFCHTGIIPCVCVCVLLLLFLQINELSIVFFILIFMECSYLIASEHLNPELTALPWSRLVSSRSLSSLIETCIDLPHFHSARLVIAHVTSLCSCLRVLFFSILLIYLCHFCVNRSLRTHILSSFWTILLPPL